MDKELFDKLNTKILYLRHYGYNTAFNPSEFVNTRISYNISGYLSDILDGKNTNSFDSNGTRNLSDKRPIALVILARNFELVDQESKMKYDIHNLKPYGIFDDIVSKYDDMINIQMSKKECVSVYSYIYYDLLDILNREVYYKYDKSNIYTIYEVLVGYMAVIVSESENFNFKNNKMSVYSNYAIPFIKNHEYPYLEFKAVSLIYSLMLYKTLPGILYEKRAIKKYDDFLKKKYDGLTCIKAPSSYEMFDIDCLVIEESKVSDDNNFKYNVDDVVAFVSIKKNKNLKNFYYSGNKSNNKRGFHPDIYLYENFINGNYDGFIYCELYCPRNEVIDDNNNYFNYGYTKEDYFLKVRKYKIEK